MEQKVVDFVRKKSLDSFSDRNRLLFSSECLKYTTYLREQHSFQPTD
jgi:hypothetical protein